MQLIALIWGILAIIGFGIAFMPCLGSLNWLNIPFSIVGLIVCAIAIGQAPPGRRGTGTAGLILCLIAVVLGFVRLMAGHFVL